MPDRFIEAYINEERERCAQLCEAMDWSTGDDKAFLIHCIRYAVQLSEIDERRARFAEFPSEPVDQGIEDLM